MIFAIFRVMALNIMRDRGALAMAFLLPPTIFVIFAAIFSGASGDEMRIKVAMGIERSNNLADRLQAGLQDEDTLRLLQQRFTSEEAVTASVKAGQADAGIYVAGDLYDSKGAPITIIVDPGKVVAGAILNGQVQKVVATKMPDIGISRTAPMFSSMIGGFTPEQSKRLEAGIASVSQGEKAAGQSRLLVMETIETDSGANAIVSYYAGAVAILFLLFSAMQNAATLIEERNNGIMDRVAVGPAGTDVLVFGKFIFLTAQGVLQVTLIFLIAAVIYHVNAAARPLPWLLTTIAAAAAAAGLGLATASVCTSKQQAQTISTFVVLVLSAIGGSMVPRFMMPSWLQEIGWFTPNAWAIEAYHGALWRGETFQELLPELAWLSALAVTGVFVALAVSRARLRIN